MKKMILLPSKYVQDADVLNNISEHILKLEEKGLVAADDFRSYSEKEGEVHFEKFNGE